MDSLIEKLLPPAIIFAETEEHLADLRRRAAEILTADTAAKDQRIADLEGALDQIQGAFDLKDAINLARATLNATPKEG